MGASSETFPATTPSITPGNKEREKTTSTDDFSTPLKQGTEKLEVWQEWGKKKKSIFSPNISLDLQEFSGRLGLRSYTQFALENHSLSMGEKKISFSIK